MCLIRSAPIWDYSTTRALAISCGKRNSFKIALSTHWYWFTLADRRKKNNEGIFSNCLLLLMEEGWWERFVWGTDTQSEKWQALVIPFFVNWVWFNSLATWPRPLHLYLQSVCVCFFCMYLGQFKHFFDTDSCLRKLTYDYVIKTVVIQLVSLLNSQWLNQINSKSHIYAGFIRAKLC